MQEIVLNPVFECQTVVFGYMMMNKELTALAKLVYSRIGTLMDDDTDATNETFERIAFETGSTVDQVVEAMSELQEKKFISITYYDEEQFECHILQHECMFAMYDAA